MAIGKSLTLSFLAALALIGVTAAWLLIFSEDDGLPDTLAEFSLQKRPQSDRFLFDYASALRHYEEGAHNYLERLGSRFHIEALIVTVPDLPPAQTPETLAVDLINQWRIGAQYEGRGLLLLLVDKTKQVRLEVSYALEDVFTDAFSGYIEDLQLAPYYRAGDLGTGLVAVMEMLEERARIKHLGKYTPELIIQTDATMLAGGAGARRDLQHYEAATSEYGTHQAGRGARSPEEAWEIMLTKWAGKGADLNVDVYTEMTRMAMGSADKPDPRTLKWLDHWNDADYQVLRQGNHAVIWFGAIDGWENAPFLFCNTGDGWKFDIVWQRRLVVMAENPKWQVMQGPFPYITLMDRAWQSTGKDLPLTKDDIYNCVEDTAIAARMAKLKKIIDQNPDDLAATLGLMRLYIITDQRPNLVRPLIKHARQLAPDSVEIMKYSAIYNVNSVFQYRTALKEMERYIELRPDDPFGYDMKGFMLYRLGDYKKSIDALEQSVKLDPDNGYAYALMARDYAMLARKASGLGKGRYRDRAMDMKQKARTVLMPDSQRMVWLDGWLSKRL